MYGDRANQSRIQEWIESKIDATYRKNMDGRVSRLEDMSISQVDMYPNRFVIYSTNVDASVTFDLNRMTGAISVSFSDKYGGKGGSPWWCLAVTRSASRTCSTLATADAPYDISILEYLRQNVLVQTGPTRAMTRRVSSRSGSGSRSGSNRSTRSRRETAATHRGNTNASRRRSRS